MIRDVQHLSHHVRLVTSEGVLFYCSDNLMSQSSFTVTSASYDGAGGDSEPLRIWAERYDVSSPNGVRGSLNLLFYLEREEIGCIPHRQADMLDGQSSILDVKL